MQTQRRSTTLPRPGPARNGHKPRIIYPESDGKPLAESPIHLLALFRGFSVFDAFLADNPMAYVAADNFIYYEEGNPSACVAPDLYVVKGVPKLPLRNVYKLWIETIAPCFIIEYTSPSTAAEDRRKLALYARLGVAECFLHDPRQLKRRRTPVLQGFRLGANGYEPIPAEPDGGLLSRELGIRLIVENGRLEFYALASGQRLLDPRERAAAETERAAAATENLRLAEQQLAAEAESRRLAEQRAEAEARAARTAAERIAELEARLRDTRPSPES